MINNMFNIIHKSRFAHIVKYGTQYLSISGLYLSILDNALEIFTHI